LVWDMSLPTTFVAISLGGLGMWWMAKMEVHRDQRMVWQWECYLCSASGEQMVLRMELADCNELGRDLDI
jgi:hypothetical protein